MVGERLFGDYEPEAQALPPLQTAACIGQASVHLGTLSWFARTAV